MEVRSRAGRGVAWGRLACSCLAGCAKPASRASQSPPTTTATPAVVPTQVIAPAPARPEAGEYATEAVWGRLSITQAPDGGAAFMLSAESAGSGCSFSGRLQGNLATVFDGNAPGQCALDLAATPAGIRVGTATAAACDTYCGSNGSYEGNYLRLAPACTPEAN